MLSEKCVCVCPRCRACTNLLLPNLSNRTQRLLNLLQGGWFGILRFSVDTIATHPSDLGLADRRKPEVITQIQGRRAIPAPIHPGKLKRRGLERFRGNDLLQRTLNPGDREGTCIDCDTVMLHTLDLEGAMRLIAVKTE